MISIRGLSKRFGQVRALQDIDLVIQDAQHLLIAGPNGSGKTTLLRTIAGLSTPSAGFIEIDGSKPKRARARIGYLGHSPLLYPQLTVRENLEFFAGLYRVPTDAAQDWLEIVGLTPRAEAATSTLSRGELQRAAIARALIHDPDIVLADEPFNSLDAGAAETLPGVLSRAGRTLVLAMHDIQRGFTFVDRVITLTSGRMTSEEIG